MNTTKTSYNDKQDQDDVKSLRGTLFSVMMVGVFISLMFVGIFWLYMSRV